MGIVTYDLPVANTDTSSEEPKIITALSQIKSTLNGGIDDDNLSGSADIALSKLVGGSSKQIIVADGAGIPQWRTVGGDVTVGTGGNFAISPGAVTNAMLAGSIAGSKLAAGAALANLTAGSITDDKLANEPSLIIRRPLFNTGGKLTGGTGGPGGPTPGPNTWILGTVDASSQNQMMPSGTALNQDDTPPDTFRFSNGDHDYPDKTTSLLMRVQVETNATAPACNFIFAIYPFNIGGAANKILYTVTTAVGNAAIVTAPGASGVASANTGVFTAPGDDQYVVAVTTSADFAANSVAHLSAQIYALNV